MSESILIFEPEKTYQATLSACAETAGLRAHVVAEPTLLARRLRDHAPVGLALIGPSHASEDACNLIAEIRDEEAAPPVIALSGGTQPEAAIELLQAGAVEVLPANAPPERLCAALRRSHAVACLESDLTRIKGHGEATIRLDDIAGTSDDIARAVTLGERAARLHLHVLLEGERGVGKGLMAQAIHAAGGGASTPFQAIDCTTLSGPDADRVLFDRRGGAYWRARGGDLFLHDVGALPASAQIRLATLLETPDRPARELLSDSKPEVRLLASTSRDMIPLVKQGVFRDDLFYRLNVCPIWMPPLRNRREDMPALAHGFARAFALKTRRRAATLSEAAAAILARYDWPGNLQELERDVFRAVLLAEGPTLEPQHFPRIAAHVGAEDAPRVARDAYLPAYSHKSPTRGSQAEYGPALVEGMPARVRGIRAQSEAYVGIPAFTERGEVRSLEEVEADMIRLALGRYRGSMTEAARRLGIGRSTLYRKMREFGLDASGSS